MKFIVLLLPLFIFSVSACSKSKTKPPTKTKLVYHGDPIELLAGATTNVKLPFTLSNYKNYNDYIVYNAFSATEYSEVDRNDVVDTDDLEEDNAATEELDTTIVSTKFKFSEIKDGKISYDGMVADSHLSLQFVVDPKTNTFQLVSGVSDGQFAELELKHFSITPDNRFFSLLLYVPKPVDKDGKSLIALYFAKDVDYENVIMGDTRYFYTQGRGVKMGWDTSKPMQVYLCGSDQINLSTKKNKINLSYKTDFITKWQNVLSSKLTIEYVPLQTYPPFSDLNTSCIYQAKNRIESTESNAVNYAFVISQVDATNSRMYDSDMFVFHGEHEKYLRLNEELNPSLTNAELQKIFEDKLGFTLLHEFGHMLGLDHVFDGTQSVMSYDFDILDISDFDKESILHLYE